VSRPARAALRGGLAAALALAALVAPARAAPPARSPAVAGVYQTPLEEPWVRVIHEALLRARAELGVRYDWTPSVAPDRFEAVLREKAGGRYGLIVGDAFGQEEVLRRVARAAPGVRFLFGSALGPSPPNLGVFDNWLHEPAYLSGLLAGKLTRSHVVGVVGAKPVPEVNRLVNAFAAGAREADPGLRVLVAFIDSWYDPPRARQAALRQIDGGADVLYAERAGVIEAARDRGVLAFGNIVDQRGLAPDTVVTGPTWDMFPVIRLVITAIRRGAFEPLDYGQWTMMQRGGAALAPLGPWEARLPREALDLLRTREQAIRTGLFRVAIDESPPRGD
jgi:basic membrane lipoprotein Med (substrate-binding protein (PBP1-ABC) superfamily)